MNLNHVNHKNEVSKHLNPIRIGGLKINMVIKLWVLIHVIFYFQNILANTKNTAMVTNLTNAITTRL